MKIVTYNLRCVWDEDGINGFVHRIGMTWDKINQKKPDIVCFQEVIPKTLETLKCIMPESKFADQSIYPRICVMTMLREKQSGQTFRVYNLHLDLVENARLEGIECVWAQVQQHNTKRYMPCVILGDFNANPNEKSICQIIIRYLLKSEFRKQYI